MSEKISVEWNGKKSFVCVDYPAVVVNDDKMMKTLGGKEQLARVVENPTLRLPLKFRPDDAFCKPVYGDRENAVTRVLLKVKRAKGSAEKNENLNVEMLGIVGTTYEFKAMADFQYLPMTRSENGDYKGAYKENFPTKMHDLSWMKEPVPMFMPPFVSSRMDTPCTYDFGNKTLLSPNEENNNDGRIGSYRKKRSRFAIYVKFTSASVPDKPTPECAKNIEEDQMKEKLIKQVQKLFQERPVWSKFALKIVLKCSNDAIREVLPYVSYYFESGPWRALWVRFGYDPRKVPEAKMYQTIDLRLRRFGDVIPLYSKWRGGVYGEKAKITNHISEKTSMIHKKDLIGKQEFSDCLLAEDEVEENAQYSYYKGVIPTRRQSLFQLCDIYLDQVQSLVRENDGREKHCELKEGWFEEGFAAKCRSLLVQDIKNSLNCVPEGNEAESEQKNDSEISSDDYEDEEK